MRKFLAGLVPDKFIVVERVSSMCCVVLCCVVLCCVVLCCVVLCCVVLCQGLYCGKFTCQEVCREQVNFFYAKIRFLHSNTLVAQQSRGTKNKISIANIIMQILYLSRVRDGFLEDFTN